VGKRGKIVDTRSKALKRRDRGKCRAIEDLPVEQDNSPTQSLGENSVDRPPVSQFVTTEQLGETLKQVQAAVIQGVCEKMKVLKCQPGLMRGFKYEPTPRYAPPYQQNGNHSPQAEPSHAGRIIKAQQALRRAQVSMAPSRSVTTPHAYRSKGVAWYEEHKESLHSDTQSKSIPGRELIHLNSQREGTKLRLAYLQAFIPSPND